MKFLLLSSYSNKIKKKFKKNKFPKPVSPFSYIRIKSESTFYSSIKSLKSRFRHDGLQLKSLEIYSNEKWSLIEHLKKNITSK